ncbi:MAG: aldehyde dehydrogenase family protein, partial [Saprospiraceae bacterium]|nr:aldehyde dehydrogenase family protein [Saprospiraceae bacterium]
MYQSVNPTDQAILHQFPTLNLNELEEKINLAKTSFLQWRDTSFAERARVINQFADHFERRKEELAKMISLEMGKPYGQAVGEVEKCVWLCRYTAEIAEEKLQPVSVDTDNHKEAHIWYQPIGGVLGVMPWNFPYWQALRFGIPALMAGNVVFLKPAPNVPRCGAFIEEIFQEVVPDLHLFQTVYLSNEAVSSLLENPFVQGVALTGSERAGAAVASKAASEIKKAVLELGGSDAFVVLEDADLQLAAEVGVQSRMNNSGQTCIAAKRFIVVESVAEEFIQQLKNNVIRLLVGDPLDPNTDIGPLAR